MAMQEGNSTKEKGEREERQSSQTKIVKNKYPLDTVESISLPINSQSERSFFIEPCSDLAIETSGFSMVDEPHPILPTLYCICVEMMTQIRILEIC